MDAPRPGAWPAQPAALYTAPPPTPSSHVGAAGQGTGGGGATESCEAGEGGSLKVNDRARSPWAGRSRGLPGVQGAPREQRRGSSPGKGRCRGRAREVRRGVGLSGFTRAGRGRRRGGGGQGWGGANRAGAGLWAGLTGPGRV